MRRNEHHNLLKTHILKGLPSQLVPWGVRRASELKLVANTYISECCVWLLRPISRALPLAPHVWRCGHHRLALLSHAHVFPAREVDILVPAPVRLIRALSPQPMRAVRVVAPVRVPVHLARQYPARTAEGLHRIALRLVTAQRLPSDLLSAPPRTTIPSVPHVRRVHASEAVLPIIRGPG